MSDPLVRTLFAATGRPEPADRDLLARYAATGDGAAFELLVRRHARLVWRVCRAGARTAADAEDATQATFLALARSAGSVTGSVPGWLAKVARNAALKASRYASPRPPEDPPACDPEPADVVVAHERAAILHAELARLPARYRLPLVLCYLAGHTQAEAADRLGWPVGTVATRVHRACSRLRDRLARRGIALSAGAVGAALSADVPAPGGGLVTVVTRPPAPGVVRLARAALAGPPLRMIGLASAAALVIVTAGVVGFPRSSDPPAKDPPKPAREVVERGPAPRVVDPAAPRPPSRLLGDLRFRHNGGVAGLAYRPDGKALATTNGSSDYTPRVWDLATGAPTVLPGFHFHGAPNKIAFSPDGTTVYVGGHPTPFYGVGPEGSLCVWDPKAAGPRRLNAFLWDLSADGKTLVTVEMRHDPPKREPGEKAQPEGEILRNYGHRIVVWDGAGKESREVRDFPEPPSAIGLSADGRWLAVGHEDGSVRRIHLANRDEDDTRTWTIPKEGPVRWLAFSPDGKRLGAICDPPRDPEPHLRTIRVWDTATAEKVSEFAGHLAPLVGLVFRPDGRLVSVDGKGVTTVWDVVTGESVARHRSDEFYSVGAFALTPDGSAAALAAQTKDRTAGPVVMDLKTGALTYMAAPADKPVEPPFKLHEPIKPEQSGASIRLAAGDGQVRVTNSDVMKYDLSYHDPAGKAVWKHPTAGYTVWVTPDGQVLSYHRGLAGSGPGKTYELRGVRYGGVDDGIEVRALKSGELLRTVGGTVSLSGGRFWLSPDGKAVAVAHNDERVRVWDAGTGELRRVLDMPPGWGYLPEFAFSADGRFLFGRGPGIGVVWSLTDDPAERP